MLAMTVQPLAEATLALISHKEKSELTIIKTGAIENADSCEHA